MELKSRSKSPRTMPKLTTVLEFKRHSFRSAESQLYMSSAFFKPSYSGADTLSWFHIGFDMNMSKYVYNIVQIHNYLIRSLRYSNLGRSNAGRTKRSVVLRLLSRACSRSLWLWRQYDRFRVPKVSVEVTRKRYQASSSPIGISALNPRILGGRWQTFSR